MSPLSITVWCLGAAALASAAPEVTVVYDGATSKVSDALPAQDELWLTPSSLTTVSRFVLKPQGACLDELCIPIPKAREKAFLRNEEGAKYFNLSELARVLHQPSLHDDSSGVWVFGTRPESRMKVLDTLEAPGFTLPDWRGTPHSLADYRGKKVLLITWASW